MSLFSPTGGAPQKNPLTSKALVKTMQDDLDAINGIAPKAIAPEDMIFETAADTGTKQQPAPNTANPFMTQERPQSNTSAKLIAPKKPATVQEKALPENKSLDTNFLSSINNPQIIIALVTLVILLSSGGAYYFITTRKVVQETQDTPPIEMQQIQTETVAMEQTKTPELFSVTAPNFLPIDGMNQTPEEVQSLLVKTKQQAASLNSAKPIEFIVTDANNNPLTFASFAKLSGITLSTATMEALGDTFSLFVYANDINAPRFGLIIEIKNKSSLQTAIKQEESTLVKGLSPLLPINDATIQKTFSDGVYKTIPLRYTNLAQGTSTSVDYALIGNHIFIGTSMDTHHALIDLNR